MLGFGRDRLSIYLNDHLAGATAGAELARRTAASNRSSPYGSALTTLAEEIEADRRELLDIMERLSVRPDRLKLAFAWGAEKLGRLKLNGAIFRYSPLSRLEELEGLSLGVEGKLVLWNTLRQTHGDDPRLHGIDLDELVKRARAQLETLAHQRSRAADEAIG